MDAAPAAREERVERTDDGTQGGRLDTWRAPCAD